MAKGEKEKLAAGGVVVEAAGGGPVRVLLVHRPRYDDWSLPKGGIKEGESFEDAALREVLEETGLRCRILKKLAAARYKYRTRRGAIRPKVVHYFLMEQASGHITTDGVEVDRAGWFDADEAGRLLSYDFDRELLAEVVAGF